MNISTGKDLQIFILAILGIIVLVSVVIRKLQTLQNFQQLFNQVR